ncbi:MAG TPA: hypothetical protein VG759_04520 [Candidatus Angelobacter sp.]|jgi:uncharacterized repeat protein (TIGR01451 family)|nr:hypothetical protein [Candidatus Angelobacter sp.]
MRTAKNLKAALVIVAALTLYLPLQAEVKVALTASKITKVDGTEKKEPGDKAKPGDVIEYVAEYKNSDKKPVQDVVATLPVPAGMEYVPSTAEPGQLMASTSDGKYAPAPLKRAVRGADGKVTQELVPYSEYRSLRWNLGVMAGGTSKTVRARMKVKAQQ